MSKEEAARDAMRSPSVSLHQLRLFVTLARHRSFTRAGDEFGITQSAVSRGIRELEDEIALRLFDRTTRQVALTETGSRLLARIAPLVEELEATLRPHDAHESGVVTLASSGSLTSGILPPMLASCRARWPETTVSLCDRPQDAVLQLVRSGEADIGLVVAPGSLGELVAEPLFEDGFAAVAALSHPLVSVTHAATHVDWRALRGHPLVLLDDDAGSLAAIESALASHAVTGAVRQPLTQACAVVRMAAAGLGVGIVPLHARAASDDASVRFIPLVPETPRTVMLVRRRAHALRPGAARLWSHLQACASQTLITPEPLGV
jgi:DNA-binding transcriptional LysR family regulator